MNLVVVFFSKQKLPVIAVGEEKEVDGELGEAEAHAVVLEVAVVDEEQGRIEEDEEQGGQVVALARVQLGEEELG